MVHFPRYFRSPPPYMKWLIVLGKLIVYAHIMLLIYGLLGALFLKIFNPPIHSLGIYRWITRGYLFHTENFIPISRISPLLPQAIVTVEDAKFFEHIGIDFEAVKKAWKINLKKKRNAFGGSTITQQLARTMMLMPQKWWIRKYAELYISLEFELILSKDRMLELYYNYVEWGPGIYGAPAGALYHYKKALQKLKRDEIIRLVVILANPLKYTPANFAQSRQMRVRYRYLQRYLPK